MTLKRLALIASLLVPFTFSIAHGQPTKPGKFTATEETIIARNDSLIGLRRSDPAGLRRILDALARAGIRGDAPAPAMLRPRGSTSDAPFDPAKNPDLVLFHRASPEAANDLFQLLKKVGSKPRS